MARRQPSIRWPFAGFSPVGFVACGLALLLAGRASAEGKFSWHIIETANFRVMNYGARPLEPQVADECEAQRAELAGYWLEPSEISTWTPKCDVVVHPTDASYLREVGAGGAKTVASSLIDRKAGRVSLRRIDIRLTGEDWQATALGHELTHVIIADRFAGGLPRWVDEGVAILADPYEKQLRHRQDLTNALAQRREFRLLELITLADYPAAHRWGTFYGQSASVVKYLIQRSGPQKFLEFVALSQEHGYEHALRETYQSDVRGLESNWQQIARQPGADAHLVQSSAPTSARPETIARKHKLPALPISATTPQFVATPR